MQVSPYGAKETYDLFEVKDGWFERSLAWVSTGHSNS